MANLGVVGESEGLREQACAEELYLRPAASRGANSREEDSMSAPFGLTIKDGTFSGFEVNRG